MRDQVTFCIKTIDRPQCCAAMVRTIHEYCGSNRPAIHVLDDGKPELRFSTNCPVEAGLVDELIETEYDIGLSAGRNRLLDSGNSPVVVFTDDDHLVTARTRLPELVDKLNRNNEIDLLAALSNNDERPRLLRNNGT
ncbi:MAG: glycosyltransferase family A protein [Planctomycetota bacterium]